MDELLYTAFDVACIINNVDLSTREALKLARHMYTEEKMFLAEVYRDNYRKWLLDVLYWSNYMQDKVTLDAEFPSIQAVVGDDIDVASFMRDDYDVNLFFKKLRCQILYFGKKDYVRMKLRTLMGAYGYKRRTKDFVCFLKVRLSFYHIQTTLRGNEICDIETMNNIDNMITFRVM